jgi:hypothetical protein
MNPDDGSVPPRHAHLWSPDFDTIEVYNGVDLPSEAAVLAPMFDWLNLLARGHRYTATGNSDSHNLFFLDPGLPRNLIHWGDATSDDADRSAPEDAILAALKQGRVIVTSGPLLDVTIGDAGPGETANVPPGPVDVRVRVRAVPWVDVTRLRVYVGASRAPVVERAIPRSTSLTRLDETFALRVPDGGFVVALVTGDRPLENVYSKNARPLAFSNPVWVRIAR